jgi:S1-C subfamily serine protease
MSENNSEEASSEGQGYLHGPSFGGGNADAGQSGYGGFGGQGGYGGEGTYPQGAYPPPPPPPPHATHHKRALVITGAAALVIGATVGGVINGVHGSGNSGVATATSKTTLTASQIASRVDPGLVDVVSTDGDVQATSEGTGIVLSSSGEILTNNHVIEGATSIKVTDIGNGKTYTAQVVGYDASSDVAVLRLVNASGLTVASLGNSSTVTVGASVVALGNAEGKGGTPSEASGTVTALDQSITASDELSSSTEQLQGLIESNAPIEPGDSGGSLVNAYGQVVGMDTAASSSYTFQGQSQSTDGGATQAFSIPINTALSLASQIEGGSGSSTIHIGATAFLGVSIDTQGSEGSDQGGNGGGYGYGGGGYGSGGDGSGQQTTSGAYLEGVVQGDPAAKAGLAEGDTITSLGGSTVSSYSDISKILVKYHPSDSIQVGWVDSEGQSHTASLTLASGPAA